MKKSIILLLLLLLITPCLRAQKKEMSQARSYLKSGRDFEKAEKLMRELLNDSANKDNLKIHFLLVQSVLRQYEAGNERLYLHQQYDTAQLFKVNLNLFNVIEAMDSVDAKPDHKGRIRPKYRERHAQQLDRLRANLFFGGTYFLRKADYNAAYRFFEHYIACARMPLFSDMHYDVRDKRMAQAAYWATYSAYKMADTTRILTYADMAMADSATRELTLQYVAEKYRICNIDSSYHSTLRKGFNEYPTSSYFFPHLIDFYLQRNRASEALAVADSAIANCDTCELYLFAKNTALLNLGRYDECIALGDTLIARNDSLADAYYNVGTAYLNKAIMLENKGRLRSNRTVIHRLYAKSRPYMERYRALRPDDKDKWGTALYRVYLNLNMGKQFDEIDKLINSK